MNTPSNRVIAAWLALFLFGVYLLTFSGRLYSGDGMSMLAVTESAVKRGEFNTDQLWTLFKSRNEIARDGESYAKYGFGASLFAAPFYALAFALPVLGLTQTTMLASATAIALAGMVVFLSARRLQFSTRVAGALALVFGLATPAWVYARQLWSEPFALLALLATFYFLRCYREHARARDAFFAGIALACAVAVRVTNLALAPVLVWYAWSDAWHSAHARRALIYFSAPLALVGALVAGYNWVRFGALFETGYRADETFTTPILLGVYGLLFSPGKGLFVYVPAFAALAFSFPIFFRRAKREAILFLWLASFYLATFSLWYYWWGGTSWGPRFLVPLLPFLVLALAPAIELAGSGKNRAFQIVLGGLVALSFAIEILGVSIPAHAYRNRMVRLSPNPEYDAIFLPALSPLIGSLNLIRPTVLDFGWLRVVENSASVDWLAMAATGAFVLFSGAMVYRPSRRALPFAALLVVALALFSLYRFREDARFGGGAGYRALVQTAQAQERAGDVMILNDDARVAFFLNENRARMRWYGLSRDPAQFDAATRALLERLAQRYARVWFAYDNLNAAAPDPTRAWLEEHLRPVRQFDFDDDVHLILFSVD